MQTPVARGGIAPDEVGRVQVRRVQVRRVRVGRVQARRMQMHRVRVGRVRVGAAPASIAARLCHRRRQTPRRGLRAGRGRSVAW